MAQEYKTIELKLNGKQSLTVPIELKRNGHYLTEEVDIIVRGFLKFEDVSDSDTELYESESYQRQSANTINDKTIVHPVLFVSDRITVENGRTAITLLPRSEDIFEETSTIQERAGSDITDSYIVSQGGISGDEQITNPGKNPVTMLISTGQIRRPYKISIQVTVVSDDPDGPYGQTVDRGTNPVIEDGNSVNSLFRKEKKRIPSNLVIDCYNNVDWIPSINRIIGSNNGSVDSVISNLNDLSYSTPFGASLMYDSLVSASDLMSDTDIDAKKKLIYLFTDNESSISTATVDNAITEINNIDGDKEVPVLVSNMGIVDPPTLSVKANTSDTRDINKIAFETGGQALTIVSEDYLDDVSGIFYSEAVGALGYGTYEFVKDLGAEVLVNSITANFNIPISNASASWSIETSTDGYNYTSISTEYQYNETADFDELYARYIKFKIVMITGFNSGELGDEYLTAPPSPSLTSVRIIYNTENIVYLYLNLEDEGVSPYQVVLGVDANEVNDEQIKIGVANSNSSNWQDYHFNSKPSVNQNGKVIIPIRFSQDITEFAQESLDKVDNFTLKAHSGPWDPYASVIIYNKNDEIISTDQYKLYPRDGLIILGPSIDSDYVDGDYKIGILNDSNYKVGLKISNKSESTPIEIYGIGYQYTTGKDLLPPVSKASPEASSVVITNEVPHRYSIIEVSYTYFDTNYDPEDLDQTKIHWYINGNRIDYLSNLRKWNDIADPTDPFYTKTSLSYPDSDDLAGMTVVDWVKRQGVSILNAGDKVYYEIEVSDGSIFGTRTKSGVVEVIESVPVMDSIFVKAQDSDGNITSRLASDTMAVISPPFSESFHADTSENNSEIIWYVNGDTFKRGIYGIDTPSGVPIEQLRVNEIGVENFRDYGLRYNNRISVQVVPRTATATGDSVILDEVVVQNSLPKIYDVEYSATVFPKDTNITLNWTFFDFEITALGDVDTTAQEDRTTVKWYRKLPGEETFTHVYTYNDPSTDSYFEVFEDNTYSSGDIRTSIGTHSSIIDARLLAAGQQWYAELVPYDTYDFGTSVTSDPITITN